MRFKKLPLVNSGSMADVAFTLLIFFLVSTTLATDKGERVLLPKWEPCELPQGCEVNITDRNLLLIQLDGENELTLEGQPFEIEKLQSEIIRFLLNNKEDELYSDNYDIALVELRMNGEANYDNYLEVYSNIKAAFTSIRNDYALKTFGKIYEKLNEKEFQQVQKKYPLKIVESIID